MRHKNHLPSDASIKVVLSNVAEQPNSNSFIVSSETKATSQKNCEGLLKFPGENATDTPEALNMRYAYFRRGGQGGQLRKRRMLYETIFSRVVAYSELYQTIDYLELDDSGQAAWGSFRLRQPAILQNSVSQPVFVDTLLHTAGFLANCFVSSVDVCICVAIERVRINADEVDYTEAFRLYPKISSTHKAIIGNSFAYENGKLVGSIKGVTFRRLSKEGFTRSLQATMQMVPLPMIDNSSHRRNQHSESASPSTNGV